MNEIEFRKDFIEEVKATAVVEGNGNNDAFVQVATNYLIGAEVISDFTPAFYNGNGKNASTKARVDGFFLDEFDMTLNIAIADYVGSDKREKTTMSSANSLFEKVIHFIEAAYIDPFKNSIEPSTAASDLVLLLNAYCDKIRKFRILLITDGQISDRIIQIPTKSFNNIPIECQIWDIDRIFRVCSSENGKQDVEIDFTEYNDGKGIPCIEASATNNNDYTSFLCIIPGTVLADIYDKYGSQLLEGNVRSFLSTKVAVNKKIRETILRSPQNFFAYNNGVAATAADLKIESQDGGRYLTYAKDFQIINGGQTTASLSNARHKDSADLSKIFVQMKLTEVDDDATKSSELIRNISRSSNSQNKVSDADFFSTHPFHVRIEQLSGSIYAPAIGGAQNDTIWFYERARGQYLQSQMRMTKAQKDKFVVQHPKNQVITKTDLAKYRNSWDGLPHEVSKGAQTNFMKFAEEIEEAWSKSKKSNAIYNDKYFKDTVALAILFKRTEYIVSHQTWFEQGYRANIVTYSIALLHKLIKDQFKGYDLDLGIIWNKQSVPTQVESELIKITKYVFDTITDPSRGTINVTQWCKRDLCWEAIKKCDIKLSKSLKDVLVDVGAIKGATIVAVGNQVFFNEVEAQKEVVRFDSNYWIALNEFAKRNGLITETYSKALRYAMRIPENCPDGKQSIKILELLKKAEENGFTGKNE